MKSRSNNPRPARIAGMREEILLPAAASFAMFSILPIRLPEGSRPVFKKILRFFPPVGLMIGLAVFAWQILALRLGLSPFFFAVGAVLLMAVLSGGIHLDGYADTADAVFSRRGRDEELRIMKDPNAGSMAVIALILLFLLNTASVAEAFSRRPALALCCPFLLALSRCFSALMVLTLPSARPEGMAASMRQMAAPSDGNWLLVQIPLYALPILFLDPLRGSAAVLLAAGLFFAFRHFSLKRYGGTCGDLAGALLCLTEALMLLCFAF